MSQLLACPVPLGRHVATIGRMLLERRRKWEGRVAYRERRGAGGAHAPLHPGPKGPESPLGCRPSMGHQEGRPSAARGEAGYESWTFGQLYDEVRRAGTALVRLGMRRGDRVALLSRNRREMLVLELATMSAGGVAVPIFSEYPADQLDYLFEHSGARWLAVSDSAHLREALRTRSSKRLERVFLMEGGGEAPPFAPSVVPFAELLREPGGAEFDRRLGRVAADEACLLMYTSGTTGRPKGVLLSHRNILSQRKAIGLLWDLGPSDRFLAYLPWHHSFGGIFELFGALYSGASLTRDESYGKDIPTLIENFKAVRPTVYFSVPRVTQALVTEAQRSPELERAIFHPELRFVFTAAAALPAAVAGYLAARKVPVVEGWGLTETSPCVTLTPLSGRRASGVVGRPLPGVRVRLADDGEILVQGPNVMLGYYKDAKRTGRVIDPMGWFHTGDYGELSPEGLVLKGRIDGLFKLISGQMVAAPQVEAALTCSPLISFAAAFGSGENFVGAVLFPSFAELARAARARGAEAPAGDWTRDAQVRELLAAEVRRACAAIAAKYQRPRAFVIAREEPSLKNGQITPTLKIVKSKVAADYAAQLVAMFKPEQADRRLREEVIRIP